MRHRSLKYKIICDQKFDLDIEYEVSVNNNIDMFLRDTATGEVFNFPKDTLINWYNCGPTIYNRSHLGHARTFCLVDNIRRYLLMQEYKINFGFNITDIDDKIAKRVKEIAKDDEDINTVYRQFIRDMENFFWDDYDNLNLIRPDIVMRVSDVIPELITFMKKLIDDGYAYQSEKTSSVYFDLNAYYDKFPHNALARGGDGDICIKDSFNSEKKNPHDFALWKAKSDRDIAFESEFGMGTPGWHLECSVMASMMFGDDVYMHSGGIDLLYPHHHNEILQSTAYWNKKDVIKNFIHTGHLHIDGEKMSQSLKNFKTIHEVLQVMSANELRLLFISTPWNGIMDLNFGSIENAKHVNNRVINLHLELSRIFKNMGVDTADIGKSKITSKELDNNFNNVGFIAEFNEYITGVNNTLTKNRFDVDELIAVKRDLLAYEYIIGLDYTYLANVENNIRTLANMRNDMRKTKIEDISKLKDMYKFTDPKFFEVTDKFNELCDDLSATKIDIYKFTDWIRDRLLPKLGYKLDDLKDEFKIYKI